ncbi:MAG TPA: lipopolysaccharide heptosyltransferase II [Verrucomicrobiae bacterium]|nr:lipopolysaccharide heptosyltransferase II [Verrucomicrobiae bacterium]
MDNESILVRGVNWLGDAIMSTPALQRLREARPDARITLLTPEKLKDLWPGHPAIDDVITFKPGESMFSVARKIRAGEFEIALILPNSPRSALECRLGRVPRRIGYPRSWRNWMLTTRVAPRVDEVVMEKKTALEARLLLETGIELNPPRLPERAHHIFQYLELVKELGGSTEPCAPFIEVSDEETKDVYEKFDRNILRGGNRDRPLIGINPGAEYGPAKCWPKNRFIEAAVEFTREHPCDWWVFGGPNETALSQEIAAAIDGAFSDQGTAVSLAGKTSLRELCAGLKAVDALITNDSGPMHVAAAVGTPVVAIFGSTSPELTGPGLPGNTRHQIVRQRPACSPCFLRECPVDFRCMNDVNTKQVVKALKEQLQLD